MKKINPLSKLNNIIRFIRKSQSFAYGDFGGVFRYNYDYVSPSEIAAPNRNEITHLKVCSTHSTLVIL